MKNLWLLATMKRLTNVDIIGVALFHVSLFVTIALVSGCGEVTKLLSKNSNANDPQVRAVAGSGGQPLNFLQVSFSQFTNLGPTYTGYGDTPQLDGSGNFYYEDVSAYRLYRLATNGALTYSSFKHAYASLSSFNIKSYKFSVAHNGTVGEVILARATATGGYYVIGNIFAPNRSMNPIVLMSLPSRPESPPSFELTLVADDLGNFHTFIVDPLVLQIYGRTLYANGTLSNTFNRALNSNSHDGVGSYDSLYAVQKDLHGVGVRLVLSYGDWAQQLKEVGFNGTQGFFDIRPIPYVNSVYAPISMVQQIGFFSFLSNRRQQNPYDMSVHLTTLNSLGQSRISNLSTYNVNECPYVVGCGSSYSLFPLSWETGRALLLRTYRTSRMSPTANFSVQELTTENTTVTGSNQPVALSAPVDLGSGYNTVACKVGENDFLALSEFSGGFRAARYRNGAWTIAENNTWEGWNPRLFCNGRGNFAILLSNGYFLLGQ